jgi:hypothetical protein
MLRTVCALVVVAGCLSQSCFAASSSSHTSLAPVNALPIVFEPTADASSGMLARIGSTSVQFLSNGIQVLVSGENGSPLSIGFPDARNVTPHGEVLLQSQTNYLLGNNSAHWRTHVPNFARVAYAGLYPGIDAVFYGSGQQLEYDFLVAPGADYRAIRLQLPVTARALPQRDGSMLIENDRLSLRMQAPVVYQVINGRFISRSGGLTLQPGGELGFSIESYDPSYPLVIDPVFVFSTYLGTAFGEANHIATDSAGNSYITGAGSLGYPVTQGALQACSTCTSNAVAIFVSKLSADGTTLLYSTILGGNSFAQPTGIGVDANGNVVVSGWTGASDFPTLNGQAIAPQVNNYLGVLFSLSADGSSFNYSTLLGAAPSVSPPPNTYAMAMAVDASGNAYVTGETGDGFYTSPGALNNQTSGMSRNSFDVYLAKFAPDGTLLYSAVLGTADPQNGGGGPIGAGAVAVDANGNAYVGGQAGTLWPITSGAYKSSITGNMPYAAPFVTKVAPDATSLVYSTFLDAAYDVRGLVVTSAGEAIVAGNYADTVFPTTTGAYMANSGTGQPYLTSLNAAGSALKFSTMVCTSCSIFGLSRDSVGNLWLFGQTSDTQFPIVSGVQATLGFNPSAMGVGSLSEVQEFNSLGTTLKASTFLGGIGLGYASDGAVDNFQKVHVAGAAVYNMFTTANALYGPFSDPGIGLQLATYPYAAVLDMSVPAPVICASPNGPINFNSVGIGNTSTKTLTLSNCGNASLAITGTGTDSTVFSVNAGQNHCITSLAVGQSCTLSLFFIPTLNQTEYSILSITSNAAETQTKIGLVGFGSGTVASTVSPSSLGFDSRAVGTSSAAQSVTLTNTGTVKLSGLLIQITGTDASSFSQINNCASPLAVSSSCTLQVVFSPNATGSLAAALTISATGAAAQSVSLTGTAVPAPFTISPQSSSSTSATVIAGTTATYALALTPALGYSGSVSLSCSGAPTHASCSVSPTSVTLSNSQAANITVSVTTGTAQAASNSAPVAPSAILAGFLLAFMGFGGKRMRRTFLPALLLIVVLCGIFEGCGGGGNSGSGGGGSQSQNVVPGTYPLKLTANDGTTSINQTLTLIVK